MVSIEFSQQWESRGSKGNNQFSFNIKVAENLERLTAEQWADKQWDPDVIRGQKNVTLSGIRGHSVKIFDSDQSSNYIYLAKGDLIYELSFGAPETMSEFTPNVQQRFRKLFQRIMKTFQLR